MGAKGILDGFRFLKTSVTSKSTVRHECARVTLMLLNCIQRNKGEIESSVHAPTINRNRRMRSTQYEAQSDQMLSYVTFPISCASHSHSPPEAADLHNFSTRHLLNQSVPTSIKSAARDRENFWHLYIYISPKASTWRFLFRKNRSVRPCLMQKNLWPT